MDIAQQLKMLPATPGVYIYKDTGGSVLYVGKAKVLKSRVRSYWQAGANLEPMKVEMIKLVKSLETISTDTENEALILEANLIRKYQPPYNVVLRDDKYYLFIKITKQEPQRVFLTRRISKDGARYFGPYSSAKSVRGTLRLLRRIFPVPDEKDSPNDIIFPHPLFSSDEKNDSQNSTHSEEQKQNIQNIIRFLQGKRDDIISTLKNGMAEASKDQQFEQAALFRDQLEAIERLEGFQKVYLPSKESFDALSLVQEKTMSAANVFQIREGKLLNKLTFLLRHRTSTSKADALRQFILQYYGVAQDIPNLILIPEMLSDAASLSTWIRTDNSPQLIAPERGKKRQLIAMGDMNAQQLLSEQATLFTTQDRLQKAHEELMHALGLNPETSHRVETYDISNIQGRLATASMVVFIDGVSMPKQYRKFRIRMENTPNDFAMLQETLQRRFAHLNEQDAAQKKSWPSPDLIIIDGGKGQLSAAKKILDEHNITIPLISLAKQEEEIFTCPAELQRSGVPLRFNSLRLPYDSQALYLIQRMRDEAHRFTITYHRLLRSKQQRRSLLDEVPGIGPKNKKKLLAKFGSLKGIRAASDEDLSEVLGEAKTKVLREYI